MRQDIRKVHLTSLVVLESPGTVTVIFFASASEGRRYFGGEGDLGIGLV